jgi:hypothetical protein
VRALSSYRSAGPRKPNRTEASGTNVTTTTARASAPEDDDGDDDKARQTFSSY